MKIFFTLVVCILFADNSYTQQMQLTDNGGGPFFFESSECVPKELADQSIKDIEANRATRIAKGILPATIDNKIQAVQFQWPLRLKSA